jgi:transposase
MIAVATLIGIDVSRKWLDGFCVPCGRSFRLPNLPDGHMRLIGIIQDLPAPLRIGFEGSEDQDMCSSKPHSPPHVITRP